MLSIERRDNTNNTITGVSRQIPNPTYPFFVLRLFLLAVLSLPCNPPCTMSEPAKHFQTARQTPFIYGFKRDCMQRPMRSCIQNRMLRTDWIHKSPQVQSDIPGRRAIFGDKTSGRANPIGGIC